MSYTTEAQARDAWRDRLPRLQRHTSLVPLLVVYHQARQRQQAAHPTRPVGHQRPGLDDPRGSGPQRRLTLDEREVVGGLSIRAGGSTEVYGRLRIERCSD